MTIHFAPTASGTRTGTLSIASNDPSNPIVSVQLQGVGYATAPVPQITSLSSQLVPAGVAETNFTVSGFGFLPSSVVEVNGAPQQTGYRSSTSLSANLVASSIPANSYGELAVTVVTPAPGGGTSAPYTLTEFQPISVANSFMTYEPVSKQLFVSTPAVAAANPNTVLPVNPVSATVGSPIPVGNDPGVLATSADGKYLYVALNGDHTIQRINLSTNAIERTFSLPIDPQFGNLRVFDMHVVPSDGTEVVASLMANVSPSEDGIAFFNDTGLVNWIPGLPQSNHAPTVSVDRFTFTNNPSTLYADTPFSSGFAELTYSSTGLQNSGNSCCIPANNGQPNGNYLATDGALLYTNTVLVWNPANNGQLVETYALPATSLDSVIPDASTTKTYYLNQDGQYSQYQATTILAFDQSSQAQTGSLSFTGNTGSSYIPGTQLIRWGSNEFAFRASNIFGPPGTYVSLFTSSIASASNLNPTPVATTLAPASTPAAGADFTLTVNGSGFIQGSTVEWNGSPRLTTVVSSTQITATIYASDIAVTGAASVVVANPGQGGGTSAALSLAITAALPPAPIATLSPASLTFASQAVGTSSNAQTVTLTNSGNADLSGIAIALNGANAGSFAQTNTCGSTVSAGTSCLINMVFTPTSAGGLSANLAVTDNAATSPQSIGLSGTAVLPPTPIATLSPTSLTFASQAVGTSSSGQTVTLTNSGNADLSGIVIAISGANTGSFAQTSTCSTTLSAGKSCLISLVFTPTSTGSASATLVVTDNAATSPQTVGLSGTAPQAAFVIAPQAGGNTTNTVTAGQPATYSLSITPANGYSGTVVLTCNNLPTNASCSFAPSSLALGGSKPATFTVTIATEVTQTAALLRNVSLGSILAGFMFLLPFSKKHRHGATATALLLFAVTIGLSACGGGPSSSGTTVTPPQAAVAPGTYTVQAVASDGTTKQTQSLTLVVQ